MTTASIPLTVASLDTTTPYAAYSYSYPHKSAYRPITPARNLGDVWSDEAKDALFLYVHLPFCEMRCGFCNLFTTANPADELVERYLDMLEKQCAIARNEIAPVRFARSAIGGGTPTYLSALQLDRLFDFLDRILALDPRQVPMSVETSPRTADEDRLRVLSSRGVSRISIGVQSMVDSEVNAAGRAQKESWVLSAIDRIRNQNFATLNIDLIYGLPGQSVGSWLESLKRVVRLGPEELYLYPLYVRPLTGLGRRGARSEDQLRVSCYREARDVLLSSGYEQLSMRMFRFKGAPEQDGPVYCCQDDGMLGLGCGARSYTQSLHYSSEYAVGASDVKAIIQRYVRMSESSLSMVDYGCYLDRTEQKRRYVIKSLLRSDGLNELVYSSRFGSDAIDDVPELIDLINYGLIKRDGRLQLTEAGMEKSDSIGPFLYSATMRRLMDGYELK
jgi:oxygen-independent coproporphyrinogen-3 oxidase